KDASLGTLAVGPPAQPPALVEDGDGFLQISADLPAGWALAYRAPGSGPVRAGETLRVTLRWRVGEAPAPVGRLCAGACVDLSPPGGAPGAVLLDWYEVTLPPGVSTGTVMLLIDWGGAGNVLAEYDVQAVDHLLTPPPFAVPVGVTFAGAGELVGFSTGAERLTAREALPLMLVWRAAGASDLPYAVFVHLLDAGGRVIAQSDRPPAGGERPTTGWVAGEYIVDEHALVFNEAGADYTGPATLEVGLYDPLTGARAPLEGGGDFVILPVTVEVIK
ncbi:MAG: hypothetical protein JXB47_16470, partial [Anaerolineae bacterium]|nr:hypothetical protein [Anaerolineae bacterium]